MREWEIFRRLCHLAGFLFHLSWALAAEGKWTFHNDKTVSSSNEDSNPKWDTLENRTSEYMELKREVVKFIAYNWRL